MSESYPTPCTIQGQCSAASVPGDLVAARFVRIRHERLSAIERRQDHGARSSHSALTGRPHERQMNGWQSPLVSLLSNRNGRSRWIIAAVLMSAVIGLAAACGTPSAIATSPSATTAGSGSNARSGPASGGSAGTVASVSTLGFTLSTSAGQKVTIHEVSSTTYQNGASTISANAITTGQNVLVLGTTSGTTITATQVIVQPTGSGGSAASSAAGVIPFQPGAASPSKSVGQIPANYSQGSGTIVSGPTANSATEAALAAYPGGIIDRVVQLSNGEYEVHNIGVNWPHHIFVDQDFKVVGAN